MAQKEEIFTCSICLQLMEDPVTIGCGHSFCMRCINTFWDRKLEERATLSCPHCRQSFNPRPILNRNALLAELLEEHKKTFGADAADGGNLAEGWDVFCDACTGKTRHATKFCLTCLASYCETHLKPHFEVPPLRKHKLIQAAQSNKEVICVRHNKLLELHCRTDCVFICALCVVDGHTGHDTVAVIEEMRTLQVQLEKTKDKIADRVTDSQRKMTEVKEAANFIRDTAWTVCDEFEQLCAERIRMFVTAMEKKCANVREKVGEAEKTGVDWANSQLDQLRSEVNALRKRDGQLTLLLQTEQPIQFIKGCQDLSSLPAFNGLHKRLESLPEFVIDQNDVLKNVCNKEKKELNTSLTESTALSKLMKPDVITSRQHLLTTYKNHKLELDSNTVAACLSLSGSNRELSWGACDQSYPDHSDRFTFYPQALCKQGFTDDTYWEVEWDGGIVEVAVSYRGIERKGSGNHCCFGHNNFSWKLVCSRSGCRYWHNNLEKPLIPPAYSCKLGVHLKYQEGIICFYSIHNRNGFTLLHKTETIFTEPLYPGFSVDLGSTLKICTIDEM